MKRLTASAMAIMLAGNALAGESLRCGTHLITEGDLVVDLLEHCGEPTRRVGNQWIYDFGDNAFVTVVTLRGNDLDIDRIEQHSRD